MVGLAVRRKMIGTDHSGEPEAFTISDLRRMHRQGHLTDEEFESVKDFARYIISKRGDASGT